MQLDLQGAEKEHETPQSLRSPSEATFPWTFTSTLLQLFTRMLSPKITSVCLGGGQGAVWFTAQGTGIQRGLSTLIKVTQQASNGNRNVTLALATAGEQQQQHSIPTPFQGL